MRPGALSLRLPRPTWRSRSVGAFPAASCCSGIKESGICFFFLATKAPLARLGVYFFGSGARGILRASSGKVEECAFWIAAAATAVAGDEEAVATPAGEPRRRAEARGSESQALASVALGRAGGLAGGRHCGCPGRGEAPRKHPPRDAGAAARLELAAARCGALTALFLSLCRCLARAPGLHVSSPSSPRRCRCRQQRPQPGALLARSHSTAYRLTPCMPPGPPAASWGAGQSR